MDEAWKRTCDVINYVVGYLQTIQIAEIRQTLELLGIQHVEVAAALMLFLMLQFTKFTAVLLLACLIAFSIFYMWDTWFPELRDGMSGTKKNNGYGTGYGAGYGPGYGAGATSAYVPQATYERQPPLTLNYSFRDARTSALLPPYGSNGSGNGTPGERDQAFDQEEKRIQVSNYLSSMATTSEGANRVNANPSGAATPVGHGGSFINDTRPHRRPYLSQFEDRYMRRHGDRDPPTARKMTAHEYRLYRSSAPNDANQYHRYSNHVDDHRVRRSPGMTDDPRAQKNRRNATDNRSPKRFYGNEQHERFRNDSPDNMQHRSRNPPAGNSNRSNGRSDPAHANPDNRKRRIAQIKPMGPIIPKKSMKSMQKTTHFIPKYQITRQIAHVILMEIQRLYIRQTAVEISSNKSNASYPYVIEMVEENSVQNMDLKKSDGIGSDPVEKVEEINMKLNKVNEIDSDQVETRKPKETANKIDGHLMETAKPEKSNFKQNSNEESSFSENSDISHNSSSIIESNVESCKAYPHVVEFPRKKKRKCDNPNANMDTE